MQVCWKDDELWEWKTASCSFFYAFEELKCTWHDKHVDCQGTQMWTSAPKISWIVCTQAYLFDHYWEDIGTIKSFFDANLALPAQIIAPYIWVHEFSAFLVVYFSIGRIFNYLSHFWNGWQPHNFSFFHIALIFTAYKNRKMPGTQ